MVLDLLIFNLHFGLKARIVSRFLAYFKAIANKTCITSDERHTNHNSIVVFWFIFLSNQWQILLLHKHINIWEKKITYSFRIEKCHYNWDLQSFTNINTGKHCHLSILKMWRLEETKGLWRIELLRIFYLRKKNT